MPFAHKLLQLHILFNAVSESALLDSGSFHTQVIKLIKSVQKSFFCSYEPMEVHFNDNSYVISSQIVYLPFISADIA